MTAYLSERTREVLAQVLMRDAEAVVKARRKRRRDPDYRADMWEPSFQAEDQALLRRAQKYDCLEQMEALLASE